MVIEIKERGENNFYDEFLYVVYNYPKILKNPKKKIYCLSKQMKALIIISFIMLALTGLSSRVVFESELLKYISYFFYFLVIFGIMYFFGIKKRIKEFKNVEGTITLKLEEQYIEYLTNNNNYQVKWQAIKYIIISNYSICFIPTENTIPVIGVSRKYEDDVLKGINELKKEELLVRQ